MLPAVILVVSVVRLRTLIDKIGVGFIESRQKLIKIHTVIFIGVIATNVAVKLFDAISYESRLRGDHREQCKLDISSFSFGLLQDISNLTTIVLFTYMSILFSEPVSQQVQKLINNISSEDQN